MNTRQKKLISELGNLRKQIKKPDVKANGSWEDIFQAIGHPTFILDPLHTITAVNRAVVQSIGLSEKKLIGKKCYKVFHNTNKPPKGCPLEKLLISLSFETSDMEVETLGGIFSVSCTPVLDKKGHLEKVIHIATDITELRKAERKIQHLNLVLRAIRSVNQLITREKDMDRLLKRACELLIENRGYYSAWIALFDESRKFLTYAEAGLSKKFQKLVKLLKSGKLSNCIHKTFTQPGVVVTKDPSSECTGCPLSETFHNMAVMTIQLKHGGRLYGLLHVSTPKEYARDMEEQDLLKEVAGDIAFAFHDIELEEEQKRLEQATREALLYSESIVDTVRNPLLILDANLKVVSANRSFYRTFKVNPEETGGQFIYELGNRQWDIPELRELLEGILPQNTSFDDFEVEHDFPHIGHKVMILNARKIYQKKNKTDKILLAIEDITERKKAELEIKKRVKELEDFYEIGIGRELRMIELKKEIESLKEELARYKK